ncbi:hypothetical protein LTR97_011290 [Elasticomyces elasticus]|uniref:Fungal N-terminal domain-containing protein n=1 Tax=Elasticomyces elasticus TaxID=574655 RepID=A0AAN7VZK3_9PEZI|nr:hypothetical protein LTR97_011290 [Elasticomyces elasticus]
MEGLAGAASVVALIGLSGQCISGAERMISFCNEVRGAEKRVQRLHDDINSLLRSLQDAAELSEKLQQNVPATGAQAKITSLRFHLDDCDKAFVGWLEIIGKHQQKDKPTWFKQVWRALNRTLRDDLHNELSRRRDEINLTLMTIGSTVNLQTSKVVTELAPVVKATEQNIADLQKSLEAALSDEEFRSQQVHATLQFQTAAISQCSSEESLRSLRSEISASFKDLKGALETVHRTQLPDKTSEGVKSVDMRILLKWIGAGRPKTLEDWMLRRPWIRHVPHKQYGCSFAHPSHLYNISTCILCHYRGRDVDDHITTVHRLGLGECGCSKSLVLSLNACCDHLRTHHGPVALDRQNLKHLVVRRFSKIDEKSETISSLDDAATASKVIALLLPGATVDSKHLSMPTTDLPGHKRSCLSCKQRLRYQASPDQDNCSECEFKLERLRPGIVVDVETSDEPRRRAADHYTSPQSESDRLYKATCEAFSNPPIEFLLSVSRSLLLGEPKVETAHEILATRLELMGESVVASNAVVTNEQAEEMTLMQRSWNAALLEDWDSTHDRINKWMLHVLGSDCDGLAAVHRGHLLEAQHKHTTALTTLDLSGHSWERLVLKYWFLDEAALSFDALAASRADAHLSDLTLARSLRSHKAHLSMGSSTNEAYANDVDLECCSQTRSGGEAVLALRLAQETTKQTSWASRSIESTEYCTRGEKRKRPRLE